MKKGWERRLKRKFGHITTCAYCEKSLEEQGHIKNIIKFIKNETKEFKNIEDKFKRLIKIYNKIKYEGVNPDNFDVAEDHIGEIR